MPILIADAVCTEEKSCLSYSIGTGLQALAIIFESVVGEGVGGGGARQTVITS